MLKDRYYWDFHRYMLSEELRDEMRNRGPRMFKEYKKRRREELLVGITLTLISVGIVVLIAEWSGAVDYIINSI